MEFSTAMWYANVLSGHKTQITNFVSTFVNSFFDYLGIVGANITNPKVAAFALKGWIDGLQTGFTQEARDVMRTGYNPIRGKVEYPATLEMVAKMKKGDNVLKNAAINYAKAAKYVRRVMIASDVIFYEGAKEMKAYALAIKQAQKEGKLMNDPSYNEVKAAMNILNINDEKIQEYQRLATDRLEQRMKELDAANLPVKDRKRIIEQLNLDYARDVWQQIQNRNADVVEVSNDFARRATFNYKPEGTLGLAVNGINMILSKAPALRFIVPFTNIIANVADISTNYTPLGLVRAGLNRGIITNNREELSPEARAELVTKSFIGIGLFAAVAMLAAPTGDDDDPPWLEITANGTGSFNKNYSLQSPLWQSYSFRVWNPVTKKYSPWIKYDKSPLIVPFSMLGTYFDTVKYQHYDKDEMMNRIGASAMAGMSVFLNASYLQTINTFFNTLFSDINSNVDYQLKKLIEAPLNIAKGFVIPNFFTQISKEIQEDTKTPIKDTTLEWDSPNTYIAK